MAEINNFFELKAPKSLDSRYLKNGIAPYMSTSDVNSAIIPAYRHIGLQVLISVSGVNKIFCYRNGVTDGDLIEFPSSVGYEVSIQSGAFTKTFPAGKILESILIDPPDPGTYVVNIGSTFGANDILQDFTIDGNNPDSFIYTKYFKTLTNWYFSGIPTNSQITFFYKKPI